MRGQVGADVFSTACKSAGSAGTSHASAAQQLRIGLKIELKSAQYLPVFLAMRCGMN
ncbi:hypothetical protein [Acinetobacter sp.]|uniref:hypothetical protein n=1 Tax=Acinetobacter sp. TaxID=472 RepID=UPI0035B301CD